MDALIPILVVLSFLLLGVGIFLAELLISRRHLREVRIVRCPAVEHPAAVRLQAGRAAVDEALGRDPDLAIDDCTRWPRARGCDQRCLEQLEGSLEETTLARRVRIWIEQRKCSGCGRPFADAPEGEVFLVSPLGTRFEWTELPPDWLAEAIEGWEALCERCGRGVAQAGTVGETMTRP